MASLLVATGGTRLGIRMARPKFLAVNGITAFSIAPSRTCRCQSSGLRMVMRVVMRRSTDRRGSGDERVGRLVVDHRAGQVGDARKSTLGAPLLEPVDDREHAGWVAE